MFDLISAALAEDVGTGDVTSLYFVSAERQASGRIVARHPCVVAGIDTAVEVFARVDPTLRLEVFQRDGYRARAGEAVMRVEGGARPILTAERTALNFLQRLSGVATLTARYVDAVAGTRAKILDTRKTTPGWRALEKAAVKAGGGTNHRAGLFDMILVKDNHLAAARDPGALRNAISCVRSQRPRLRIELEADTLAQVEVFLGLSIDVILLDNMSIDQLRTAVALRAKQGALHIEFEASGGVNLDTVRAIAETGVDLISVGALTHSATAVDLALDFD